MLPGGLFVCAPSIQSFLSSFSERGARPGLSAFWRDRAGVFNLKCEKSDRTIVKENGHGKFVCTIW
jgi:hypothetical protein